MQRSPVKRLLTTALLLLACLTTPSVAWAQGGSAADAELLDIDGTGHFKNKAYRDALVSFRQAYTAYPNANSAWNIARCYEELGELHNALKAFAVYSSRPDVSAADKAGADTRVEALKGRLERWKGLVGEARKLSVASQHDEAIAMWKLALEANVDASSLLGLAESYEVSGRLRQAQVVLDQYLALTSLSTPQQLAAQQKRAAVAQRISSLERDLTEANASINALRPKADTQETTQALDSLADRVRTLRDDVDLEAGSVKAVRADIEAQRRALEGVADKARPDPDPKPPQGSTSGATIAGWSLVATGGLAFGFGVVMGVQLDAANTDIATLGESTSIDPDEASSLTDDANSFQTLQFVGYGLGVAALATGVVLLLLDDDTSEAHPHATRLAPWLMHDGAGIMIEGDEEGDDCPISWRADSCMGAAWNSQTAKAACGALCEDGFDNTAPVGSFPSGVSPDGLFDMAGNAREWVDDWFDANYYDASPESNPGGPTQGTLKVFRGGGGGDAPDNIHTYARGSRTPDDFSRVSGFRCATTP